MPNYELGLGSPYYSGNPAGDMGFGAPYTITVGGTNYSTNVEQGFGDAFSPIEIIVAGNQSEYGDNGGNLIKLKSNWRDLFDTYLKYPGPFKIYVKDADGVETLCISGLPGLQTETYADHIGQFVSFILPVGLNHGIYSIMIYYGTEYSKSIEMIQAIEIKKGLRDYHSINIKSNVPQYFNIKYRNNHWLDNPNNYTPRKSNIENLLEVIGEQLSEFISANHTIVTQYAPILSETIHVESTLGFPNIGILKIGQTQIIYTSKTDTSFELSKPIYQDILPYTTVNLINQNLEKIDNYYLRQVYNYSKPELFNIKEEQWDDAFRYLQFSEQYAMPIIFNYFSELTKHLDFAHTCVLTDTTNQIFIIEDITKEFNLSHVDRFIEIDDIVYYSERLVDVPHISDPEISVKGLKLVKYDTAYWRPAQFNDLTRLYNLRVKPFNIVDDFTGKFYLNYEKTIFGVTRGFIQKDFIEENIYFDNLIDVGESNFKFMTAAGIDSKITRVRNDLASFGTYINPALDPDAIIIQPDNILL